jgi:hypothetical protein
VCRDTIYTACERGELHHIRIGGRRSIRLKREWIDGGLSATPAKGAQARRQGWAGKGRRRGWLACGGLTRIRRTECGN